MGGELSGGGFFFCKNFYERNVKFKYLRIQISIHLCGVTRIMFALFVNFIYAIKKKIVYRRKCYIKCT